MAEEFGERTEPATPRRRQDAREKGQVAKSQDLTAAAVMLAGLVCIDITGPWLWRLLLRVMHAGLSGTDAASLHSLLPLTSATAAEAAKAMAPVMIVVFLAGLGVLYWQVGVLFTWHPVMPSLNKINPLQGIKRIFSPRTAMSAVTNVGKVLVMTGVAYLTVASGLNRIMYSVNMDHISLYVMAGGMLVSLGIRLAALMLILALLDYWYQRHRHERDLRMSKEEIKEELKRMEGDPLMKRRRREVQMRLAMQRVQRDVPRADVVVTNPTHVSIALRYDAATMQAPKVVAKGADWLALRIRQIAAAAGVPIVERPPLARMMYESVEVGQEIPERFYEAVAEILAYVYELSGKNMGPQPVAV